VCVCARTLRLLLGWIHSRRHVPSFLLASSESYGCYEAGERVLRSRRRSRLHNGGSDVVRGSEIKDKVRQAINRRRRGFVKAQ
jgi:hypothetical protein